MKQQLYALSLIIATTQAITAFDSRSLFTTPETPEITETPVTQSTTAQYQFIEKTFITDIATSKNAMWSNILTSIPAALGTYSGYQCYNQKVNMSKEDNILKSLITAQNLWGVTTLTCATILAGGQLQNYVNAQANQQAVRNFFKNWNKNKVYTPEAFHDAFESIALEIEQQGDTYIRQNANKIVENIQFVITRHFEKRYEKLLQITAYDALNESKTVTEIIKNMIGMAKDLAA